MKDPGIELLERYFNGSVSDDEANTIEAWIRENRIDAEALKLLVTFPEGLRLMFSLNHEQDWLALKQKLPLQRAVTLPHFLLRVAAIVTLCIAVASVLYLSTTSDSKTITVSNAGKLVKKIALPDSSVVYLNTGAELSYRDDLRQARTVSMKGEAFFEVKRDLSHPFIVKVQQCKVQVLGTSFNIFEDTSRVEVTVATGRVALQSQDSGKVYLEKGDKGWYAVTTATLQKAVNLSRNYLSWKTGILEFSDTPLNEVAADIGKYFDVNVSITGAQGSLPAYTSRFEKPDLKEILEEMKLTLPIQYTIEGRNVQIMIKS